MATSNNKTVKPTGLSITRSGNTYTFKWKQGDKDYKNGQQLQYRLRNADNAWTKVAVGVAAVSASISNANVTFLQFRVAGKRKEYKKSKKTIKPLWSDWAVSGAWTATIPNRPTIGYEAVSSNSGKFSWSTATKTDDRAVFDNVVIQKQLRRDNTNNPTTGTWTAVSGSAASGSVTITEEPEDLAAGAFVRWVRVKSHGNAGDSAWAYASHAYGAAAAASLTGASAVTKGSYTQITAQYRSPHSRMNPIDKLTVEYVIAVPANEDLNIAPSSGWQDAIELTAASGNDKIVANVSDTIGDDECLWVRIKTEHDNVDSFSNAVLAQVGTLKAPTISATPDFTNGSVAITTTEVTTCTKAKTAIFYRDEDDPSNDQIIAVFAHGTTSGTISVPDLIGKTTSCFGAYAFVGASSGLTIDPKMRSAEVIDSDIAAVAPASVTIVEGPRDETVRIGWAWSWSEAVSAELAWSEFPEAWESTNEPSTYRVTDRNAVNWVIAGLETGKRYYFRVRLIGEQDEEELVGPWSAVVSYELTSVPDRPVLTLSKDVINAGDTVTARWAYSVGATSEQAYAEVAIVTEETENNQTTTVYTPIAHTEVDQSLELEYAWTTGLTYNLAVRITTTAGTQSAWSDLTALYIAEAVSVSITQNSLVSNELTEMPMTATVTGAGTNGTTMLTIVRAEDYHLFRPDEKDYDGFEGETIFTVSQIGAAQITVNVADLVGSLDDGAKYTLIATVIDEYGQTASAELPFTVNWTHKAETPTATVVVDKYQRIAKITPIAPDSYVSGDICDIYRITADQPELIFKGAVFGTTYVDPYPGFGDACGHRIVTRTANGDYASADGLAWLDTDLDDGDFLEEQQMIIDVDGDQIELPYNITLRNKWSKDFKRTSYLGGSVRGDWNPAVTRDLTAETVIVRSDELDKQIAMRDLAGYAGVAHIRTPDGSSLTCDIQIDEAQAYNTKKVSYTLTIMAIDPGEPVGVTLEEWEAMNELE